MIKKETGMKQMKNRKAMLGIIVLTAICGCRSVGTHESILKEQISGLDKLGNVMVITREDGSGTRSTFSQLTGFDEKNKETGASDLTRTDAETADSASLVLETVAQEKNAIGYVSMGALDDAQGVKLLQIDGKTLNAENVQKGTYPLSRSFYIAYYNDSAQKTPAVRKNVRGMNAPITNNATIIPTGFSSGIVGFSWPDVLQNAVIRCIALLFQEKHFR